MSRRVVILAAALALSAAPARTDELGPAMPSTPAAIETAAPAAPIVLRQQAAEALFRSAPPHREEPPPSASGETREFTADEPPKPVVNPTSEFVFEDTTERPPVAVKSLPERQAAVEAVRRSIRAGSAE